MKLQAYLDRIGYEGRVEPTLECLRQVHRRQALSVPYENLDVQLGTPLDLDIDRILKRSSADDGAAGATRSTACLDGRWPR